MRTIVALALNVLVVLSVGAPSRLAAAEDAGAAVAGQEPRRALAEGRADLLAEPPNRDAAREAFERVTEAGGEAVVLAEAHFRLGALDEEDGEFAKALEHHRACVVAAPSSRWSRNARSRIDWLSGRSEGNFIPLAHLRRMQKNPALADDPAMLSAFAQEVEGFPAGLVRSEARMLVGEALLKRSRHSEDAVVELHKVLDDPSTSSIDAAVVQRDLVEAFLAAGRLDDAASEVRRHVFDRELVTKVERLLRHRTLRRGALAELAAFAGLVAFLAIRRARRGGRRTLAELTPTLREALLMGAVGVMSFGGALFLAARYEAGNLGTFPPVGVFVFLLLVVGARAWASEGSSRSLANAAWALSCCASASAAALLLIDTVDRSYLQRLFAFAG